MLKKKTTTHDNHGTEELNFLFTRQKQISVLPFLCENNIKITRTKPNQIFLLSLRNYKSK